MENQNKIQNTNISKVPYSDRVGENREREVLERYGIIIDYYAQNPSRIPQNSEKLEGLCFFDNILKKDKPLIKKLHSLLIDSYIDEVESFKN
ncbi:hypothetical protein FJZ20_00710 [Candidatus Pacearchaeota archaeon]|nr:hypothetical protein [Candidatus Pacearchaeota archaeon]